MTDPTKNPNQRVIKSVHMTVRNLPAPILMLLSRRKSSFLAANSSNGERIRLTASLILDLYQLYIINLAVEMRQVFIYDYHEENNKIEEI